ncbi:MAG: Dam family site-specific DNA-(adenine-N6)-methyltransferase, partial [Defluviitaleaceae bacterium]|nr:Dam family site-specific DNA-(adenine-N6)-methyltransferase [Defluviitaleaceae bacterium]
MDDKIFIPPFKIQGIKSKLIPLIKANIDMNNSTLWIEPFMGSGVVGLNVVPSRAIFSDLNPHIISFYNKLKSKEITSDLVRWFLEEEGALLSKKGEEHYYFIRERFNKFNDPLDFLFLNRSCFNGMIRFNKKNAFNVPYGHKPNRFAKAYITKITNQVSHFSKMIFSNDWQFSCLPFEESIKLADDNSFIYCDPPYIGRHVDYYDSWDDNNERQLKKCLIESNSNFMLSTWHSNKYRTNEYIEAIWGEYKKITKEHFYFIGAKEANRNSMLEALIVNYDLTNSGVSSKIIPKQFKQ